MALRHVPLSRAVPGMCLAALAALAAAPAAADGPAPVERHAETWLAVGDHKLDQLRGGFDPGGGLLVTFGISRATWINGNLMTQTTLNFGQLNQLTAAQAAQLSRQMAGLNLVQNGPGNLFEAHQAGSHGTVIQNTLDNQHIVNETVINASSNALGTVRNLNAQSTVNDAIARAAGALR